MSQEYATRAKPRTVIGTLTGLAAVLLGWLLYTSNGFYSSNVFLAGVIMIPAGLVTIGWSIAQGNETPRNLQDPKLLRVQREP